METLAAKTTGPESVQTALSKVLRGCATEARTCDIHGEFQDTYIPFGGGQWAGCPRCRDERMDRENRERDRRLDIERQEIRMRNALKRAAIPPRFEDRKFDNFIAHCPGAEKALDSMRSYAENFDETLSAGRSMILVGTVGAGKTHLAAAAANSVIQQGYSAVFASVMSAIRSVKETYSRDAQRTEREAIDALVGPDLLVLDEVGVQFGSDAEKLILFEIINGRYENVRPTVLISNLDRVGLETYIGERAMDRLREGGGRMIVFDWESYRKRAP